MGYGVSFVPVVGATVMLGQIAKLQRHIFREIHIETSCFAMILLYYQITTKTSIVSLKKPKRNKRQLFSKVAKKLEKLVIYSKSLGEINRQL